MNLTFRNLTESERAQIAPRNPEIQGLVETSAQEAERISAEPFRKVYADNRGTKEIFRRNGEWFFRNSELGMFSQVYEENKFFVSEGHTYTKSYLAKGRIEDRVQVKVHANALDILTAAKCGFKPLAKKFGTNAVLAVADTPEQVTNGIEELQSAAEKFCNRWEDISWTMDDPIDREELFKFLLGDYVVYFRRKFNGFRIADTVKNQKAVRADLPESCKDVQENAEQIGFIEINLPEEKPTQFTAGFIPLSTKQQATAVASWFNYCEEETKTAEHGHNAHIVARRKISALQVSKEMEKHFGAGIIFCAAQGLLTIHVGKYGSKIITRN